MPGEKSSRAISREQADLLLDSRHYGLLELLMRGETSAQEAASALGLPLGKVHYRLTRLVAAGVAVVVREEERAGRAVKRYTSAAASWFVPFELTGAETLTALIAAQLDPQMQRVYERLAEQVQRMTSVQGFTLALREDLLSVSLVKPGERPPDLPAFAQLSELRLTRSRAQAFHRQLEGLLREFSELPEETGAEDYTVGLFFIQDKQE